MVLDFYYVIVLTLAVVCTVPIAVFCGQVWLAVIWRRRPQVTPNSKRPTVAVMVPAHNEENVIRPVLQQVLGQLTENDQLLVVADNCDDQTVNIAESVGAEVLVRNDTSNRGKSHALAFGIRHLSQNPPDVLLVVDADCTISPVAIQTLAEKAFASQRPVQASYTFDYGEDASSKRIFSSMAIFFKNHIRPLGLSRLGMPCQMTGSGMTFPWNAVQSVRFDNHALTEDTQLGIDLVIAGYPPIFCPTAKVVGEVPKNWSTHIGQRRRWEHGYLITILTQVPRLLLASLRKFRFAPLWVALDLTVPPLALLAILWMLVTGLSLAAGLIGNVWLPTGVQAVSGAMMATTIFAGWLSFCREQIPFHAVLSAPWYVLGKLSLYGDFFWNRQKGWLRTERD